MKNIIAVALIATITAVGVSGCGKKGAPHNPGSGEQIYPRVYPTE